jgi:sugar phosphate isomerase/epimerase
MTIGSQTWPHRATLKDDFPAVLRSLAAIGVQEIEMCSPFGYADFAHLMSGADVRKTIADHGLECRSGHFMMSELRQSQDASIAWAHDVGITQMFVPSLDAGLDPTLDDVKRAADEYNRMAAIAARAGIQQGLHNEGFETTSVDGRRTYDVLFDLLDPALVTFQFQMSTIRDGFEAAEYFAKYPGRFSSVHLQDWDPAARKTVAIGEGVIDWKKVFATAAPAGVKTWFIELDMDATRRSVEFLKSLGTLG